VDTVACLSGLAGLETSQQKDRIGRSPMHYAAEQDSRLAVKLLAKVRPAAVNDLDQMRRTPLHYAAVCGSARAMRSLLKLGANVAAQDDAGCMALDYARQRQHGACVALLAAHGPGGQLSVQQQQDQAASGPWHLHAGRGVRSDCGFLWWCCGIEIWVVRRLQGCWTPTRTLRPGTKPTP
jgi:hypothetical protein